jgi:hypothetical protein
MFRMPCHLSHYPEGEYIRHTKFEVRIRCIMCATLSACGLSTGIKRITLAAGTAR